MLKEYVLLDLETVGAPDAEQWLGEIVAPANYSKAETIAAYIRDEKARRLECAGLDPDLCQIVVAGWHTDRMDAPSFAIVQDDADERMLLQGLWGLIGLECPMVGYGLTWFDAGVLVRRSQLLGVPVPAAIYKQGKYRHDLIVELADYLTLNGMIEQKKGRGLDYHCKRFGIHVEDTYSGKDVGPLWRDGNVEAIREHARCDLSRIRQLAERLGVIAPVPALVA